MGPTVWELEGPMPILKSSKRLVFTDVFTARSLGWGTASAIVPGTSGDVLLWRGGSQAVVLCFAFLDFPVIPELSDNRVGGRRIDDVWINFYGGTYFDSSILYDFVLVDGPPARNTEETIFNRLGAIELIENNLADNFVAIVDDAERRGEAALVNLIRRKLQESKRDFRETAIMAAKQQAVFCCGLLYSCGAFLIFGPILL
jgi:hypothetical protein